MSIESQKFVTVALAAAGPLILSGVALLPASSEKRRGQIVARRAATAALAAFGSALLTAVSLACFGKADYNFPVAGSFQLGVYVDGLSVIVLTLVAFLLAVVSRFSINYLAGDAHQARFTKWLSFTGASVLVVVISGNLVQFALAWCSTSLCLHRLLVFYPERAGAVIAARKKFIFSRLGDVCLVLVTILVFRQFHSWNFSEILTEARHLGAATNWEMSVISFLLVMGAMLKSAQFPFHSWLPDTMETPTPVSALMHAGIINAGGFLIIRLNPLVTCSPWALSTLALVGAFTALFASLVMLTHASIKRSLAFSTIAQMGFMMLECGLGAFSLAVLHLVAHSLYKAHAFLSSGSIIGVAKSAWIPKEKPSAHPLTLVMCFVFAIALAIGCASIFDAKYQHNPGKLVLGCAFAMALAYALWNFWGRFLSFNRLAFGTLMGGVVAAIFFALHEVFARLLEQPDWTNTQLDGLPAMAILGLLLTLFLLVLVLQIELPQWARRPFIQALYVHARNGFYFNTLATRILTRLWPLKS